VKRLQRVHKWLEKVVAGISLVALVATSFPLSTYAQTVATDSSTQSSGTVTSPDTAAAVIDTLEASPSPVQENVAAPDQKTDEPAEDPKEKPSPSPQTESLIEPSTPPQNEVYNSQKPQKPEVDSNTGRLIYRYPITIPPGRKGLQPDVKLTYASGSGDLQGVFGENWSLNIPYIERVNKHGVDLLYTATYSPVFVSSEDGELATTTVTSVYAARVNAGEFRSYVLSSSSWVVTDKKGMRYTYGSSTSTRLDDSNDSTRIYRWMLEETRDTNGNYISYAYTKDSGQIYPSAITYTGHDSTPGIFEIGFSLEDRTDTATSWSFGFGVTTKKRIRRIDVKASGALARTYALDYVAGSNSQTSLLRSITEAGRSESGVTTTLPVTRFSYDSNSPAWASDTNWYLPTYINTNAREMGYKFADVNGDGLPDLVYSAYFSGVGTTYESYINDGQGWASATSWNLPVTLMSDWKENGYKIIDVNGDHLPDIVYSKYGGLRESYINNGHGWGANDSSWYLPVDFVDQNDHDNAYRILDVNGDALPDIILANFVSTVGIVYETYINNGHGWGTDEPTWHLPIAITSDKQDSGYELSDVNGDGLVDIVYSKYSANYQSYINNGSGWTSDPSWYLPVEFLDQYDDQNGYKLVDVNGDNLPDVVYGSYDPGVNVYYETYLNTGHGWGSDVPTWHLPTTITTNGVDNGYKFIDFNADGVMDIVYGKDISGSGVVYESYRNRGQVIDLLTRVEHPTGGWTSIEYKQAAAYFDGSNNLLSTTVPFVVNTVHKISTNDGTTTSTLDTYTYRGGDFYFTNPFDKKFAGFAEIDKTDNAGNVTKTFYHTGSGTDSGHGQYQDNYWKIGRPYRVETYGSTGSLFEKTINKWDTATSTTSVAGFVKLAQTVQFSYDGRATHTDKAEAHTYDNTNGNVTQTVEYGEVTGNDDGTLSDTGTDKLTTDFAFATSSTNAVVSVLARATVSDQNGNAVKETKSYFDNLSFGSVERGNLTKEERATATSTYVNVQNAYDSYGLVATSTDPRGKTTTYAYDSQNLYPATITQPHSLVSLYTYDYTNGKTATTTDANANVFADVYDGLDRLLVKKQPNPSATSTLFTALSYTYSDATSTIYVKKSKYLDATKTVDTYTHFDGLYRPTQVRRSSEAAGTYEARDLVYNTIGLLQKESLPYFSSGTSKTTATSTNALYASYTYDALERTVTTVTVLGTTTKAFVNWDVTITDLNGNAKNLGYGAYGRLIEVNEYNDGATYTTAYVYNGLGALTKITDALGNVRTFTFDNLGRRLTAQDLHATGDSTYGTWTFAYDDAGNLTQVVDPKSQTVNRTYDDINRVLTQDYTGEAGTEVSYTYDSCTQGATRLCSVSSSAVTVENTYNALGQLTQESKTITGTSTAFVTAYTYDRQGNVLTITNPDNSEVKYTYNAGGRVETVDRKESGDAAYSEVVTDLDYGPHGKATNQVNANCTQTTNTYDAAKLYRLTNRLTTYICAGEGGPDMWSFFDPESEFFGDSLTTLTDEGVIEPTPFSVSSIDPSISPSLSPSVDLSSSTTAESLPPPTSEASLSPTPEPSPESTATASSVPPIAPSSPETPAPSPSSSTEPALPAAASLKPGPQIGRGTVLGWNSKTETFTGGANKRYEFHAKQINFKDADGSFKPIDPKPQPVSNGWEVTQNTFGAFFPERSTGTARMLNNNRFDTRTLTDINEPDQTMTIMALNVADVAGVLEHGDVGYGPEWYVRYPQAYPAQNADLIYLVWHGKVPRLQKLVQFNSALGTDTDFQFAFTYPDKDPDFTPSTRVPWNKLQALTTSRGVSVGKAGDKRGFGFKEFKIWDSNELKRKSEPVTVDVVPSAGGYILTKHIPASFFSGVTFPVFTDTTSTVYPDPDPETASMDCQVQRFVSSPGESFSNIRNGAGTAAFPSVGSNNPFAAFATYGSNNYAELDKAILVFDTSIIDDSSTINSWRLSLFGKFQYNNTSASPTYNVYASTPASNTDCVAADYGQIGSTALATAVAHANIVDEAYNDWNGTAMGIISVTSVTKLAFREATYDAGNSDPGMGSGQTIQQNFDFADTAGTSTDPKLVIVSNAPPTAPASLLAEGQTNPTDVGDPTPEFSAIYNDPDSGDSAISYRLQVSASSTDWNTLMWDSATSSMATTTQGSRSPDITYAGSTIPLDGSTYYWRIKFWDVLGAEGAYSTSTASFTMATGTPPLAPTDLLAEGQTNPTGVADTAPEFSAVYNDPTTSDSAIYYRLQVSTSSTDWSTLMWDSEQTAMATTTEGSRSPDISYAGDSLSFDGSTYYWRVKFWDAGEAEGIYSTSTASFTMTTSVTGTVIQDISYTYDAVGNITQMVNASPTSASGTITFVYDDLDRLTSAIATSTPTSVSGYVRTYTYDALGNMLSASDLGSYTYATATSSGYANPHAAISIAGTSLGYDENGNVTSISTTVYTWDYQNRLTQVGNGSTTSTYGYDAVGERVWMAADSTTTSYYPTKNYNYIGGRPVKNIFANGELVATMNGTGASTTIGYVHTDHLGGSNVITSASGTISELLDYYPFGSNRLDEQTGFVQARKFIGEMYDGASALSYLNARYYDGGKAKFLSQDPVFLNFGIDDRTTSAFQGPQQSNTRGTTLGGSNSTCGFNWSQKPAGFPGNSTCGAVDQKTLLENPQALNSYAYGNNNPLRFKDPDGLFAFAISGGASGELGAGFGAATNLSAGYAFVNGGNLLQPSTWTGFEKQEFVSIGGLAGGPGYSKTFPSAPAMNGVLGASAGYGLSFTFSNAKSADDIVGISIGNSVTLGPFSVQFSKGDNGIYSISVGIGPGVGASASRYLTQTLPVDLGLMNH
jgi:RHS repeat-associated protein